MEHTIEIRCDNDEYHVIFGDLFVDSLTWDEMLGLIARITINSNLHKSTPCLGWLRTAEQYRDEAKGNRFAMNTKREALCVEMEERKAKRERLKQLKEPIA